jgi:hypothetical protein
MSRHISFYFPFPNVLLIETLAIAIPFTNVSCDTHVSFYFSFPNVLPIDTLPFDFPFPNVFCTDTLAFIFHLPQSNEMIYDIEEKKNKK